MTQLPGRAPAGYRALAGLTRAFAHVDGAVRRVEWATRHALGALLAQALAEDERTRLAEDLYGIFWTADQKGLFDWEERWLRLRLPPPPGRILIGGSGGGREAVALAERGYQVDVLEPVARLEAHGRALLAPLGGLSVRARYEQLSRAVLDGEDNDAAPLARRRYDAVLLGWGSLTLVYAAAERVRLLHAASRLCPAGPILASFWMSDEGEGRSAQPRSIRLGLAVGRQVARARGLTPSADATSAFGHGFRRGELNALAAAASRLALWEGDAGDYPHVTLLPIHASVSPEPGAS